jgi:hypothetical protein
MTSTRTQTTIYWGNNMAQFRDKPGDISNASRSQRTKERNQRNSDSNERRRKKQVDAYTAMAASKRADAEFTAKKDSAVGAVSSVLGTLADTFVPGVGKFVGETAGKGVDWLYENAPAPTDANLAAGKRRAARDSSDNLYGAGTAEAAAVAPVDSEQASEVENEAAAVDAGKAARRKRKKTGTKQILTSPLGATETAKTAVSKLGGY